MMEEEDVMLRVHSADLHDHLVQEIGECLETGKKLVCLLFRKKSSVFQKPSSIV
jgi:hypothetical protein